MLKVNTIKTEVPLEGHSTNPSVYKSMTKYAILQLNLLANICRWIYSNSHILLFSISNWQLINTEIKYFRHTIERILMSSNLLVDTYMDISNLNTGDTIMAIKHK